MYWTGSRCVDAHVQQLYGTADHTIDINIEERLFLCIILIVDSQYNNRVLFLNFCFVDEDPASYVT